ncbi:hypothetical protein AACH10_07380 [Ideonella sp. DXS22W]|uniref:Tetratricopeptide repeat protein n=1 Tax=Pseudaquabacterium inlustre TaxID=2984192 RepID=A0ABU9CDU8_9BURK
MRIVWRRVWPGRVPPAGHRRPAGASALALSTALLLAGWTAGPARADDEVPAWSEAARQRLLLGPADQAAQARGLRQALLDEAEALLRTGETAEARERLERAALMLHAADTESALVRADLQAGEYRRALAFAAHAAGAHQREWPAGMAWYAWLLRAGGQARAAQQVLADALARTPGNPALHETQLRLAEPWPRPGPALDAWLPRPYALGEAVPDDARCVGTAMLLPDGRGAVAAAAHLRGADRVWLRDGLGRTVAAEADGAPDDAGVQRLRLRTALPATGLETAPRPPYAGSPAYVLEQAPGDGRPAWPLLQQGFFGALPRSGDTAAPRALSIELPAGPRGSPVFDAEGRWAGLAVTGADGTDRLIPATRLDGSMKNGAAGVSQKPRIAVDELYEAALAATLQVLRRP